jgi:hypothetical protein
VSPIRTTVELDQSGILFWNSSTGEIQSIQSQKTFVIDHPSDDNKYLVHACLEGPEAGVYYRGKAEITNNSYTTINLPEYVDKLARSFTVQITHIYDGKNKTFSVSEVKDNKFTVYGENGMFYWIVHGERSKINTEPVKKSISLKGTGPYKWIE